MSESEQDAREYDPAPELDDPRLREALFIPELRRMLDAPIDFPPNEAFDFDPIKVRLERAVELIERRAAELAGHARSRVAGLRIGVAFGALVGMAALLAALLLPGWELAAYAIAFVELVLVVRMSRRMRATAVDCSELERLAERYGPALEACTSASELKAFAARLREEVEGMWTEGERVEG